MHVFSFIFFCVNRSFMKDSPPPIGEKLFTLMYQIIDEKQAAHIALSCTWTTHKCIKTTNARKQFHLVCIGGSLVYRTYFLWTDSCSFSLSTSKSVVLKREMILKLLSFCLMSNIFINISKWTIIFFKDLNK